jgi:sec-independent protein translocase protein TatB
MFDIGFWEIVLISIIGLVVLGPERLPVAIRTVRGWISGARQISSNIKAELSEELRVHELHSNLKKAEQQNMTNLSPEVAESVKSLQEAAAMVTQPYIKKNINDEVLAGHHTQSELSKAENTIADDLPVNQKNKAPE